MESLEIKIHVFEFLKNVSDKFEKEILNLLT